MAEPIAATYRLQLNAEQTFGDIEPWLPYFGRLGISHLYLSPIWQAAAGSNHGYDVLDHAAISDALGGLPAFLSFATAARSAGLGLILDIVPNHVSIEGSRHAWWRDVLRFGRESPYASYFDIDWGGRGDLPAGLLVVPALGQSFGRTLEQGDLRLDIVDGELAVAYFEQSFPLRPSSYEAVLGVPGAEVVAEDPAAFVELLRTAEGMRAAPVEAARALLEEFGRIAGASAAIARWLSVRFRALNGTPGEPGSFDELERILAAQHYRLAYWRVSGEQVNYRRFFDINELAAIRVETRDAFRDTHKLVIQLADEGYAAGLRVDHIDGLNNPEGYLHDLCVACPGVMVWVEKILAADETLAKWETEGTTGYDFAGNVEGLFYQPAGRQIVEGTYREFTGEREPFATVAFRARRWIADRAFDGDVSGLALEFHRLAQDSRRHRDITLRGLREALTALLASLPQYRTYAGVRARSAQDRTVLREAGELAAARDADIAPEAMAFVIEVLTEARTKDRDAMELARLRGLNRRVEQVEAPIMAKGVEDTAFYRYVPFLCQNEVGNSPGESPPSPEEVHQWLRERGRRWPLTLNATSTHDTKRSEDARMRLTVLSEFAREWRTELRAWSRMNRRLRQHLVHPDAVAEHYLYQTLVAAWDGVGDAKFVDRICRHMQKAGREAKTWTSWVAPNEEGEAAVDAFTRAVLDGRRSRRFRARLDAFVRRIQPGAEANSLALLALKCLAGGVPDFYQGSEDWLTTLTDPDNRRRVNFTNLEGRLASLARAEAVPERDRKLALTQSLLALRRHAPALFCNGAYEPVTVEGPAAAHAFAFARAHQSERAVVFVRRHTARLAPAALAEALSASSAVLDGRSWHDWLAGKELPAGARALELLAERPVVVLTSFEGPAR